MKSEQSHSICVASKRISNKRLCAFVSVNNISKMYGQNELETLWDHWFVNAAVRSSAEKVKYRKLSSIFNETKRLANFSNLHFTNRRKSINATRVAFRKICWVIPRELCMPTLAACFNVFFLFCRKNELNGERKSASRPFLGPERRAHWFLNCKKISGKQLVKFNCDLFEANPVQSKKPSSISVSLSESKLNS